MTDGILSGQTAIITGASRGLGRHISIELAKRGVRVAVSARTEHELARVAEEIGGIAVPIDVTRWDSVERGVHAVRAQLGRIDILINNAGVGWYKSFEEHSIDEIDLTLDVNLRGAMYMTKAVLPDVRQIVNIASDLGRRVIPNMAPYVASKFGIVGFGGSLLREVKGKGTKVMTVTPGIIDTFFNGGAEGTKDDSWSLRPQFLAKAIADMLELPKHWVVDEIAIHAMGQDF